MFEARLLTEVSRPLRASSPKAGLVLGIAIVGGMLLGIAIGLLRDLFDRGIAINGRFWRERQTVCIAVVPRVKSSGLGRKSINIFSGAAEKLSMTPASLKSSRRFNAKWCGVHCQGIDRRKPDIEVCSVQKHVNGPSKAKHRTWKESSLDHYECATVPIYRIVS